jgi:hypothetical protein
LAKEGAIDFATSSPVVPFATDRCLPSGKVKVISAMSASSQLLPTMQVRWVLTGAFCPPPRRGVKKYSRQAHAARSRTHPNLYRFFI